MTDTADSTRLTAKDFEKPLLLTMAELAQGVAGAEVSAEQTYEPVRVRMNFPSVDAFGANGPTGIPQIVKWIQWAFRNLQNQGLGQRVGRGAWTLTPEGVLAARALNANLPGTGSPAVAQGTKMTTPQTTVTPTPVAGSAIVALGRGYEDAYHSDPYIRRLAFSKVTCGGGWTSRSDKCKACGLAGSCRNLQAGLVSQLAAKLAAEDKAASAPPTSPTAPAPVLAAPAKPAVSGLAAKYKLKAADPLKARVDTPCTFCQQTITVGSRAFWVEANDPTVDCAIFHEGCFEQVKAEAK